MRFYIRRMFIAWIICAVMVSLFACQPSQETEIPDPTETPEPTDINGWNGESISYDADDIAGLNAATPQGYALINPANNETAVIRSLSPELDNYGGVSTGVLTLNFNYAVIFSMDVVSVYNQYIIKLFVEGEPESFYVLSDEGTTGFISVNVVDSMLSDKYREKNTQPDPGYDTGWKYANQTKNCYFYIMPKGPDGEIRTAEMVIRNITITNFNAPAVETIELSAPGVIDQQLSRLKFSTPVQLTANVLPSDVHDDRVQWITDDSSIATVTQEGLVSFAGVGKTYVHAVSVIDQSKRGSLLVNVTSGYESTTTIISYLNTLEIGAQGIIADVTFFDDIFKTTWGDDSTAQRLRRSPSQQEGSAIVSTIEGNRVLLENYFDGSNTQDVLEAEENIMASGHAGYTLELQGNNESYDTVATATIYRKIGSVIYKETISATSDVDIDVMYANVDGSNWQKTNSYQEQAIVVWGNGTVTKYDVSVKSVTLIKRYVDTDFLNLDLWQDGDTLILAPGSVRDNFDGTVTIREENPTIYQYGGIISELITIDDERTVEIVIEVTETNPSRVLWDLRILYFRDGNRRGNPLSIEATNQTGRFTLPLVAVENTFRIYLIANGSDIGISAPGAEIKIRSLKIQYIDG